MSVGLKANVDGSGAIQVGGTDAINLSTGLNATFVQNANLPNTFGFKNRIINGDMRIDQRNAGASVAPVNAYTLDRWRADSSTSSKYTVQQNAGSVTPPTGYANYLGVTTTSAYSVTTSDYFALVQNIEGYNIADLAWGTASAASVTLSFWVRSSLTGTFGGSLYGGQCYPFTYTISAANTWEQKFITITGSTSGTWNKTNGIGINVNFGLGVGSTYSAAAGSWGSDFYYSATGATSVVGTNGATFYITGVQLEKGSTATSFDYLDYGRSLAQCQRYYFRITPGATTKPLTQAGWVVAGNSCVAFTKFPVSMRIAPSALEQSGTANQYSIVNLTSVYTCNAVPTYTNSTTESAFTSFTTASAITAGQGGAGYTDSTNGATAYLGWSAEL